MLIYVCMYINLDFYCEFNNVRTFLSSNEFALQFLLVTERFCFRGTIAWDFYLFFLPVWIHLGLNVKRFWFLNFNKVPSILDKYFKFWCVSGQTFHEILRISEKDWQLSPQFSKKVYLYNKLLGDTLMLLKNILRELWTQLPILLRDS